MPELPAALPIGEEDAAIFNCPACARPLATGARRCPGCGIHLVLGVPVKRASVFVAVGTSFGILLGAGFTGAMLTRAQALAASAAAIPPTSASAPSVAPSTSASASPAETPVPPAVPAAARAALIQSATLHGRLRTGVSTLEAALAAPRFDTAEVAQALRSLASTSALGVDMAGRLSEWPDAATLATDLESFYDQVRAVARSGLAASLRNEPAYRAAATDMVTLAGGLPALDDETRRFAASAGIEMPPSTIGSTARGAGGVTASMGGSTAP